MDRQKICSFFGTESVNVYVYLAEAWKDKGFRVLINDCTEDGQMMQIFSPFALGQQEIRKLYFARKVEQCNWGAYDIVLNICGFRYDEKIVEYSDNIYIVTDMEKRNVLETAAIVNQMKRSFYIIYIENTEHNTVRADFYIHPRARDKCKGYYVMDVSRDDAWNSLKIQYNGVFEKKRMSKSFFDMVQSITSLGSSEWRKESEKERKAGCI